MSAREEVPVELKRTEWFRLLNAASHGKSEIPGEEEREIVDELIDEVIDQATITIVDMMDINYELQQRKWREEA